MARKQLSDVIGNMLRTESEGAKKCALIVLVHQTGNLRTEIHKVHITSAQPADPAKLADMFRGVAETNAQDRPGVQYYVLLAYFEGGKGEAFTEHPFRCKGEEDPNALMSETPDAKGIMSQQMRLLEGTFRMALQHSSSMLETLAGHNERLMAENADALSIVRDMILEKAQNEHGREVDLINRQQKAADRQALMKLAPPLINRLSGREVFPLAAEDSALVEAIAEKITPEQISAVASILPTEIVGLLFARFESHLKKKAAEKAGG